MARTRRLTELSETVLARTHLPSGELVVALSGGADSAALAWLCVTVGRRCRGIHIDHGLPHSSKMREAALDVATALEIDLKVVEVELDTGPSPEEQARVARYRALLDETGPGESVLTAHTRDDNLETVLINMVRGTGLRGLAGIPPHRPPSIYRPILEVARSETREIASLAGLGYVDDPMNLDPTLTRTHLRTKVLPGLLELNPALAETVGGMTAVLRRDADYLDSLAGPMPATDNRIVAPVGVLLALPRPLAERALLATLVEIGAPAGRDQLSRIWSVITGESKRQQLGAGIAVELDGPTVVVGPEADL